MVNGQYGNLVLNYAAEGVGDILGTIVLGDHGAISAVLYMVNVPLPLQKPTEGEGCAVKGQNGAETTVTE